MEELAPETHATARHAVAPYRLYSGPRAGSPRPANKRRIPKNPTGKATLTPVCSGLSSLVPRIDMAGRSPIVNNYSLTANFFGDLRTIQLPKSGAVTE